MSTLAAEFGSPQALVSALRRLREAGYSRLDAYTPYEIDRVTELLGLRTVQIARVGALAAILGGVIAFGTQWWTAAGTYPLDVGGRPGFSWPAFVPATMAVALLWGAAGVLVAMLRAAGLPRLHHPVLELPGIGQLEETRMFLMVDTADPSFDEQATRRLLQSLGARSLHEVAA